MTTTILDSKAGLSAMCRDGSHSLCVASSCVCRCRHSLRGQIRRAPAPAPNLTIVSSDRVISSSCCRRCSEPLPPYNGRGRPPELHGECRKASLAEYQRAYYESNKATLAEKQRAYYESKHGPVVRLRACSKCGREFDAYTGHRPRTTCDACRTSKAA